VSGGQNFQVDIFIAVIVCAPAACFILPSTAAFRLGSKIAAKFRTFWPPPL